MSECAIELSFVPNGEDWSVALKNVPTTIGTHALPDTVWHLLEQAGNVDWHKLLDLSKNKAQPCIEGWKEEGAILRIDLFSGEEGFDIARYLVQVLHKVGCKRIEAIVYSDECEHIIDDDGVNHPIGTAYSLGTDNQLLERDYPDVEYEYI